LSSLLLGRGRSESDLKAQSFELAYEALFFLVSIESVEVGAAEFLVVLLAGQHMIHNDQKRMGQGHCRSLLATPESQAVILSREIAILTVRGGVGGFHQRCAEPLAALAGLATESFSSTFMVAWTYPCPRGQVLSTGEAAHVAPNLGQDHLSQTPFDARNGFQPGEQFLVRLQPFSNLGAEPSDALLELGEMLQVFC
jgi:hypothetical protein